MFETITHGHEAAEEAILRQQTREELLRTVATANMLRDLLQQYERGIQSYSEAIDFLGNIDLLINARSTTDPGDEEGTMFLLGDGLKCLFAES
jgi:hypothetical protein